MNVQPGFTSIWWQRWDLRLRGEITARHRNTLYLGRFYRQNKILKLWYQFCNFISESETESRKIVRTVTPMSSSFHVMNWCVQFSIVWSEKSDWPATVWVRQDFLFELHKYLNHDKAFRLLDRLIRLPENPATLAEQTARRGPSLPRLLDLQSSK